MSDPVVEQVFSNFANTAGTSLTLTSTAIIPVGRLLVLCADKSATAGNINGISSVSQGASVDGWAKQANSSRGGSHDTGQWAARVTTQIPANTPFVINWISTGPRRAAVMAVFTEATSKTAETSSGTFTGIDGTADSGASGNSAFAMANAGDNTSNDILVVSGIAMVGTTVVTPSNGFVTAGEARSSNGSGDRGIQLNWKVVRTAATQSGTATLNPSSAWAATAATYPITAAPVAKGGVVIDGVKKAVANRYVVVNGVKKTVVNRYVIIDGVKKPIA